MTECVTGVLLSPMTEHTEQPARRAMWEYAILRSFEVPDIVTPKHAISTIARQVVDNGGVKGDPEASIEVARKIVGSIVTLGASGALDPLVVDDSNAGQLRTTLINSTDLSQNSQYAGFVLDTVTDFIRENPSMPSHLLAAAYR